MQMAALADLSDDEAEVAPAPLAAAGSVSVPPGAAPLDSAGTPALASEGQ
jgi:hypothetical protein